MCPRSGRSGRSGRAESAELIEREALEIKEEQTGKIPKPIPTLPQDPIRRERQSLNRSLAQNLKVNMQRPTSTPPKVKR